MAPCASLALHEATRRAVPFSLLPFLLLTFRPSAVLPGDRMVAGSDRGASTQAHQKVYRRLPSTAEAPHLRSHGAALSPHLRSQGAPLSIHRADPLSHGPPATRLPPPCRPP